MTENKLATVHTLHTSKEQVLTNFLEEVATVSKGVKPYAFIGLAEDGHVVLHTCPVTWKELSWVKTCFDMHIAEDWLLK